MKANRVIFLPLGHKLRALALHGSIVVAKQFDSNGYWFANTPQGEQLDSKLFCRLPVVERLYDYVNFSK